MRTASTASRAFTPRPASTALRSAPTWEPCSTSSSTSPAPRPPAARSPSTRAPARDTSSSAAYSRSRACAPRSPSRATTASPSRSPSSPRTTRASPRCSSLIPPRSTRSHAAARPPSRGPAPSPLCFPATRSTSSRPATAPARGCAPRRGCTTSPSCSVASPSPPTRRCSRGPSTRSSPTSSRARACAPPSTKRARASLRTPPASCSRPLLSRRSSPTAPSGSPTRATSPTPSSTRSTTSGTASRARPCPPTRPSASTCATSCTKEPARASSRTCPRRTSSSSTSSGSSRARLRGLLPHRVGHRGASAVRAGHLVQGRGSAANSAVCYSLGITAVDPVEMELLFERFLSEERGEWPDIDLDLPSGEQRERVIQYVYERYGERGAAMTANVITYRARSAMREVGRALGMPEEVLSKVSRQLHHLHGAAPEALDRARGLGGPRRARPARVALALAGAADRGPPAAPGPALRRHGDRSGTARPRGAGRARGDGGERVIQWDKDDCAAMGMLKIDLLGLGMMACWRRSSPRCRPSTAAGSRASRRCRQRPEDLRDDPGGGHRGGVPDRVAGADGDAARGSSRAPSTTWWWRSRSSALGPSWGRWCTRTSPAERAARTSPIRTPTWSRCSSARWGSRSSRSSSCASRWWPRTSPAARPRSYAGPWGRGAAPRRWLASWGAARGHDPQRLRPGRPGADRPGDHLLLGVRLPGVSQRELRPAGLRERLPRAHYPATFTGALLNHWPMGFYHPATLIRDAQRHGVRVLPIDVTRSGTCEGPCPR
jgi:hypothetical protein